MLVRQTNGSIKIILDILWNRSRDCRKIRDSEAKRYLSLDEKIHNYSKAALKLHLNIIQIDGWQVKKDMPTYLPFNN